MTDRKGGRKIVQAMIGALLSASCAPQPDLIRSEPISQARPPSPGSEPARLVAVTEAKAFSLLPSLESEPPSGVEDGRTGSMSSGSGFTTRSVMLPLPPDRRSLRRADVWMIVTRKADGTIADQRHAVFSRYTSGDALRFYLPVLARGSYDVEIRALTLMDALDQSGVTITREREDKAAIGFEVVDGAEPPQETVHYVNLHFGKSRATPAEQLDWEAAIERIRFIFSRNHVVRAQVDCWASTEGDREFNLRLSRDRCAEFRRSAWLNQGGDGQTLLEVNAHGADDPPFSERGITAATELEAVRRKNRVAMVRLISME